MLIVKSPLLVLVVASLLSSLSYAVTADRVSGAIDPGNVVALKDHVSPMARPQFDQGPVESSRTLPVTMLFTPSAQQQQSLQKLLADQQDSTSPSFHKWLTAEEYGRRFGVSQRDLDKISAWLQAQGFKINYVAHGRDFLSFEGNAAQVESAFKTEIHSFNVNGKAHFANVKAPSIPAALTGIVGGFRGLHDFFPHPMLRKHRNYTFTVTGQGTFTALAPGDIATIYNINPLYNAATPINGTGQKIVIAGQTDVYLADLNDFRSGFGLPAISGCTTASGVITSCNSANFRLVIPGTGGDPGVQSGDLGESDLDLEWSNAVARNAQIIFVTSSQGVDDSATWAIDNQLAPVISYSYGLCEAFALAPNIAASEVEYQKAASLGISFFASSGDAGAGTCDGDDGNVPGILGLSVSYPASSAYVTAVGGTEFDEGTSTYWGSTNGADGGSVLPNGPHNGYIPETTWNDTALSIQQGGGLDGTGGGQSNCASGTGTTVVDGFTFTVCKAPPNGGFPKPAWQAGVTPADGVRDVPDISFSASNANDPYVVCAPQSEVVQGSTSSTSTCSGGVNSALTQFFSAFGGTSASAPVAAGMTVLLNQYLGASGLGTINSQLYALYGTAPSAFHDVQNVTNSITGGTGDNKVPCTNGTPSFEPAALRCGASGTFGFTAGPGYDLVTGLGSVNINALFTAWSASRTATTTTITPSTTNINLGDSITFTAHVVSSAAVGSVAFYNNGSTTALGTAPVLSGAATFTTTNLPGGTDNVTASYLGDASHGTSTSLAATITVIAPDFTLGLSAASGTVAAGHTFPASGGITATITPINGYTQVTTLSCVSPPAGVTCTFGGTVTPDGTHAATTSMIINTAASTATGATTLTVSATNGATIPITHTSTFTLTVNATDQSFTIAPQNATYTVAQGQSANVTLTLTPTNGFNTAVTYTCTDPAPESHCSGPTGATASTSPAFTITTTAPITELRRPFDRSMRIFYAALLPGLLGIMFTAGSRKRSLRGMRMLGLIVALGCSTMWLGSCGGGGGNNNKDPGTTKGPYTIVVNATTGGANPVAATTNINLVVQ